MKPIIVNCKYQSKIGNNRRFTCALGYYGGHPWYGNCVECSMRGWNNEEYAKIVKGNPSGLGDMVHKIAQPIARTIDGALGTDLQNCGGCKNRRAALNRMFPFKAGTNP